MLLMSLGSGPGRGGGARDTRLPPMKTLLLVFLAAIALPLSAQEPLRADVCVFGATPAGVAATVGAAREGASVVLVESENLVGGMMSSGLGFSDSSQMAREALGGIFREFHRRVGAYYSGHQLGESAGVSEKQPDGYLHEPHVSEAIFNDLLREAGVRVLLGHSLISVEKDGTRLRSLRAGGETIAARVFIDATYEGDLMAKAGVMSTIGREPAHQYLEPLAGQQYRKRPMKISPFDEKGELLPLMTARSAADPTLPDRHIMAYSFRFCVTDDPANQVPIPEPTAYNPAQFELLRRFFATKPADKHIMDFYRLPNGKWDVNNSLGRQISLALVGASDAWPEADAPGRRQIWEAHRQYTLGLIHFLKTDPSVPSYMHDDMVKWSLCQDEFAATGHWPPILYIREARRMLGAYVMVQKDIEESIRKPDSIGVGSFPIDSHDCQRLVTSRGFAVDEGLIFPRHLPGRAIGQPYEMPYRSITPRAEECDNLLVPVCLSASHVAFSSVRVEPAWMVLGQSAGIAAALAVKTDVGVQALDYSALKARLLAQEQVLDVGVVKLVNPAKAEQ
jgi:glycine/D-amino acid oxidase-like deaminating enzyme